MSELKENKMDKKYYLASSGRDCLYVHVEVFGDNDDMVDFCWEEGLSCNRHNCKTLFTQQELQKYFGDSLDNNPFINVVETEHEDNKNELEYMVKIPHRSRSGNDLWLNKDGTLSTWSDDRFIGTLKEIEDAFDEKIVRYCGYDDVTEIGLVGNIINDSWWLNPIFELEEEENGNW